MLCITLKLIEELTEWSLRTKEKTSRYFTNVDAVAYGSGSLCSKRFRRAFRRFEGFFAYARKLGRTQKVRVRLGR